MLSTGVRILLLAGALLMLVYVLQKIKKNQMVMEYAVTWTLFSFLLVILSIFPGIAIWAADLLGVQSPVNLVYLVMIFILIVSQLFSTIRISKLHRQVTDLTQYIALKEAKKQEEKK